jgi:hypothetical protein
VTSGGSRNLYRCEPFPESGFHKVGVGVDQGVLGGKVFVDPVRSLVGGFSVLSDAALAPLAEAMARRIAGPDADAEGLGQARRIAEAQVDLNRVRHSRWRLISGLLTDPSYQPLRALDNSSGS